MNLSKVSNIEIIVQNRGNSTLNRYIAHAEDEPMYLHRSFQDIGEAVQHTHDFVADRLLRNGCGDGLIYDQEIGRIISIFGHAQRPKPGSEAPVVEIQASLSHDRMVEVETAFLPWRDWGGDLDAAPTFVWQTLF